MGRHLKADLNISPTTASNSLSPIPSARQHLLNKRKAGRRSGLRKYESLSSPHSSAEGTDKYHCSRLRPCKSNVDAFSPGQQLPISTGDLPETLVPPTPLRREYATSQPQSEKARSGPLPTKTTEGGKGRKEGPARHPFLQTSVWRDWLSRRSSPPRRKEKRTGVLRDVLQDERTPSDHHSRHTLPLSIHEVYSPGAGPRDTRVFRRVGRRTVVLSTHHGGPVIFTTQPVIPKLTPLPAAPTP